MTQSLYVSVPGSEFDYELEIGSISRATRATRWDPGCAAEVDFGRFVKVHADAGEPIGVLPFAMFVLDYAAGQGMTLRDAEDKLEELAIDQIADADRDAYDSRFDYAE